MSTFQSPPPVADDLTDASTDFSAGKPFLFTADAFYHLLDASLFADDDRVELWDGRIYTKMAKNKPHSLSSAKVNHALSRVIPQGWCLWPENPITLSPDRVPLPDLTLLRGGFDDYLDRDPTAADVGLTIELSDSSLRHDTGEKLFGYAEAEIPVYWVVNLVKNVVQTYESPVVADRRYAHEAVYTVGQSVPLRIDGVVVAEITALDLLPIRG